MLSTAEPTIRPLCGDAHPPTEPCIWCDREAIDSRYHALGRHLHELERAAAAAVAHGPGPGGADSSFQGLQAIAAALGAACTAIDDHADTLTQIVIANELIGTAPDHTTCPCPVCAYMRGQDAAFAQETPE